MNVEQIPFAESLFWIKKKHYAHRVPNIQYVFGLIENRNIVGVVTYGIPASPTLCEGICGKAMKERVIELNRLCVDSKTPNASSFLVGRSLKLLPKPKIIVSYADTAMSHVGFIYQATNFIYTGITKERTDIAPLDGKHSRHHLGDLTKRVPRSAKHRYVYFTGFPKEIKEMKSLLNYPVLPYPKGETKRYNADVGIPVQSVLF